MSMRALIADDDRANAAIVSRALESWKLDVTVVHDGAKAWDLLNSPDPPPLAILDWMMPRIDGIEICRRVRRNETRANTYLMLLTARDGREDVVAGLDAGADDYLIKPFDSEELRARVHVGIRILTLQERLAERVTELQDALSRVKQLTGLLPICSYCKRIRGDDQYWQQVDRYIVEHTDAKFTHGICPPCSEKLLAEIEQERQRRI